MAYVENKTTSPNRRSLILNFILMTEKLKLSLLLLGNYLSEKPYVIVGDILGID